MITSWPSVLQVLGRAPFEPKPSEKPLSEVSNFSLHSDRRAEERTKFEIKLKQKEAEIEGAKRELEMRKKREEEEEVQRLRREAVPRANPIRSVSPASYQCSVQCPDLEYFTEASFLT